MIGFFVRQIWNQILEWLPIWFWEFFCLLHLLIELLFKSPLQKNLSKLIHITKMWFWELDGCIESNGRHRYRIIRFTKNQQHEKKWFTKSIQRVIQKLFQTEKQVNCYQTKEIQYLLYFFSSLKAKRSKTPQLFSITFPEAILSSSQVINTFLSQIFLASRSARWSISVAYHFPLSLGRIPYPICPPTSINRGWSIECRICIAQRILSFSTRKKRWEFTPFGFSVISFWIIERKSSKFSPTKSLLGLVGIVSKIAHSWIISR